MNAFVRKLVVFTGGGPFLDGYILIIVGLAMGQLGTDLHLDTFWKSMIVTASMAGMFFGGLVFGYIADKIGRQLMYTADLIAMVILSVLCMCIKTPWELFLLRFCIGAVVGADYPIATALVVEFIPRKKRAWAMGLLCAIWYVGATAAEVVGYYLTDIPHGWVYMLGSSAIPAFLILLGRLGTPESPAWLVNKGRKEEALAIIKKVFGPHAEIETEAPQRTTSFLKVFSSGYFKRIFLVIVIYTTQIVPMSAIYLFGPSIMNAFGLGEGKMAILGDCVISFFFLLGCIPAMYWMQSWGRRPLIIWSYVIMTIALGVLGIFPTASIGIVVGTFALYAFFSGGPGTLEWLYPNELFPTEIRATAVGMGVAFSRIGAYFCTFGLPYSIKMWGIGTTMMIGTVVSAAGLAASIAWAPETKDQALAESSSISNFQFSQR
jgi:putative MFS transporter